MKRFRCALISPSLRGLCVLGVSAVTTFNALTAENAEVAQRISKAEHYPPCGFIERPDLAVVAFVALAVVSIYQKSGRDFQID